MLMKPSSLSLCSLLQTLEKSNNDVILGKSGGKKDLPCNMFPWNDLKETFKERKDTGSTLQDMIGQILALELQS